MTEQALQSSDPYWLSILQTQGLRTPQVRAVFISISISSPFSPSTLLATLHPRDPPAGSRRQLILVLLKGSPILAPSRPPPPRTPASQFFCLWVCVLPRGCSMQSQHLSSPAAPGLTPCLGTGGHPIPDQRWQFSRQPAIARRFSPLKQLKKKKSLFSP